jgi:putative ABC transport system ATP-binding protein
MALFQELGRSGITVIVVTHEPDISEHAARVLTMRDGQVLADRTQVPRPAIPAPHPVEAHP